MRSEPTLQKPRTGNLHKAPLGPTDPQADATAAAHQVGQNLKPTPCAICGALPVKGTNVTYHKPNCTLYARPA